MSSGEPELAVNIFHGEDGEEQRKALVASSTEFLRKIRGSSGRSTGGYKDVWPECPASAQVTLELIPLDRVGSEPGAGGSRVLVARFLSKIKRSQSKPLVVKVARPDGSRDKLDEEFTRYNKIRGKLPQVGLVDPFARPLHLTKSKDPRGSGNYSVLWSPFISAERRSEPLKVVELHKQLKEPGQYRDCLATLKAALEILSTLHADRKSKTVVVYGEYSPSDSRNYLRGLDRENGWADEWRNEVWGTERATQDLCLRRPASKGPGVSWCNPLAVLQALRSRDLKARLTFGLIHGDLHPRNIVTGVLEKAVIIDFGWAHDHAHLAKDYVLLECNLRFMTLPPVVPFAELEKFARWINGVPPKVENETLKRHCQYISMVREAAKNALREKSWTYEYEIPLFLVSLGLLKRYDAAFNQIAARLFVLNMAKHVQEQVLNRAT